MAKADFLIHFLGVVLGNFTITAIELYDPTSLYTSLDAISSLNSRVLMSYNQNTRFGDWVQCVAELYMYTDTKGI
jgi:hypothetical protein